MTIVLDLNFSIGRIETKQIKSTIFMGLSETDIEPVIDELY